MKKPSLIAVAMLCAAACSDGSLLVPGSDAAWMDRAGAEVFVDQAAGRGYCEHDRRITY